MNNEIHPFLAHRHFVVIPLVAFLLLFPLLWVRHAATSASDTPLPAVEEGLLPGKSIQLPQGISIAAGGETPVAWVQSGSEIDLKRGTILFAAQGFGTVRVGSITLQCVAGGFFLSLTNELTVSPLTSPVLVTDTQGHKVLIPLDTQWSPSGALTDLKDGVAAWWAPRTVRPVPQLFINTQMAYLQPLFDGGDALPVPVEQTPTHPYSTDTVFGYIRTILAFSDDATLQSFLADPEAAAIVQSSPLRNSALPALARVTGRKATALALLPFLMQDEQSALLLQFHPAFRDAAWVLPSVTLSREDLLLRLFALPHFDLQQEAIDPAIVDRWEASGKDLLKTEPDVPSVLIPFLADMALFLSRFAEQGYPERTVRYADAVGQLVEPYAEYLPQDSQHLLKGIHNLSRTVSITPIASPLLGSVLPVVASSSSSSESAHAASSIPPASELLAATKKALTDAGILFTVQSSFSALPDGLVSVQTVALGNNLFDFTFDAGKNIVAHISQGDQVFPNSLPLAKFVEWGRNK